MCPGPAEMGGALEQGALELERVAALEGAPGWIWDPVGQAWAEHLEGAVLCAGPASWLRRCICMRAALS